MVDQSTGNMTELFNRWPEQLKLPVEIIERVLSEFKSRVSFMSVSAFKDGAVAIRSDSDPPWRFISIRVLKYHPYSSFGSR